jgi:hypothetical protein
MPLNYARITGVIFTENHVKKKRFTGVIFTENYVKKKRFTLQNYVVEFYIIKMGIPV